MEPRPAEPRERTGLLAYLQHTVLRSPRMILPLVLLVIFLGALIAMNVLHRIHVIPDDLDVLFDSILLALFIYPFLVFLVERPLLHQIMERARTETALSESESRLRVLLESNPYFVAIRDANGVILMASKRFADYYGVAADRMIGVPQEELHRAAGLAQEDLEQIMKSDREVIESWEPRFGLEKMVHRDGKTRWYRCSRLPVNMPYGGRCVLAISSEVTRRIRFEEAQKKANEELERRVTERTEALVETNRKLKQAIDAHLLVEQELANSQDQLRSLSAQLRSALEEERTRISRELHDELGQSLTALKFDLAAAGNLASSDQRSLAQKTRSMIQFVDGMLTTVKKISRELRPGVLDDLGLAAAIQWQGKEFRERTAIPCEVVVIPEDLAVDPERATALFRIFQEALTNIARHSGATNVEAILESRNGALCLEIRDNGRGITPEEISGSKSLGILGMRERVQWVGGDLRIEGAPNAGTVITVIIPERNGKASNDQDSYCG